jgi:hypothetical protein
MIRRTLALIALALTVASCARPGTTPPGSDGPSPTVTSGTSGGTGTGSQLPAIRVTRTGGFAGVNQMITIQSDGSWSYTTKGGGTAQTGSLDAAQLAALRDLVTTPGFLTEMRQVETDENCADGFNYAITVGGESAAWEDCGGAPRPSLNKAIDLITQATPF